MYTVPNRGGAAQFGGITIEAATGEGRVVASPTGYVTSSSSAHISAARYTATNHLAGRVVACPAAP